MALVARTAPLLTVKNQNPWFASASVRSIHIPRELSYNPDLGVDPLFSSTHLQRHRELYHDQACENLNNIINGTCKRCRVVGEGL